jgi:hypothetical protein
MNKNKQMILYLIILLFVHNLNCAFNPNLHDYDAYGLKIGMNDIFFVEAQNGKNPGRFLIKFSPYNSGSSSLKCFISYPNPKYHYVYSVALAKNQTQFFFAGELINGQNGTFIGVAKYNSSSLTCDTSFSYSLKYFPNSEHQEYNVIDVEPNGRFAYGFSNKFVYIYDSKTNSILKFWDGNLIWPDRSFMPHAIDLAKNFGVISGFIRDPINSITKYIPIIYLINLNSVNNFPSIIDEYIPNATSHTWQDRLTNSDANIYSSKYDMSININNNGNILIGMPFLNRVFLFFVNLKNPIRLNYISRHTNGRSLGNGKGVTWLDNGIAAILVNTYTLHYQWLSSKIYFYDIKNNIYNSSSIPLSIYPNNHQLLPISFSPIFINIISSPSSLSLIDDKGNILILNPTLPGYYPSIENIGSMPIYSSPSPCLPGTYKNETGIHDCILCPTGTKNPGNSSLKCISCLLNSFCPLGSVSDISKSSLKTIMQVIPYPKSPESTIFDEILIQNMFSIGSGRCLVISPIFWTLIVGGLSIIMIIIMGILKLYISHPRSKRIRYRLKCLFKHTDLINEGELWIGGLASFCVIILVCFAYLFSNSFLKQYPLEKTTNSYFACDLSLRNAKFQTNIQSLSIPVTESEQEIFYLLNNQILNLNIDLINTLIDCDVISVEALYGTIWSTIRWINCINNNSILSLSIELPYQHISIKIILDDIKTIGGLRIGLYGNEYEIEHYNLKELNFYQSFSKSGYILSQSLPIDLDITKVINETFPMIGEESDFSGIYIPTFTSDSNSLFLSKDQYVFSNLTLTTLIINIIETPYYVQNIQQPIAKSSEIIFHNLLFTIVCLEIFGLVFLFYKLIIKPLCYLLFPKQFPKNNEKKYNKMTIHLNKLEEEPSPV